MIIFADQSYFRGHKTVSPYKLASAFFVDYEAKAWVKASGRERGLSRGETVRRGKWGEWVLCRMLTGGVYIHV